MVHTGPRVNCSRPVSVAQPPYLGLSWVLFLYEVYPICAVGVRDIGGATATALVLSCWWLLAEVYADWLGTAPVCEGTILDFGDPLGIQAILIMNYTHHLTRVWISSKD